METPKVIDVADFSMTPGGRYRDESEFSGEAFREEFLEPAIVAEQPFVVDLDAPLGFTSSFLEEAFGGLVRKFGADRVSRFLTIRSPRRPSRALLAQSFVTRASGVEP